MKTEKCYFCGETKPAALYLRDEKEDHPVCKTCANQWADSDQDWPTYTPIILIIPPYSLLQKDSDADTK